MLSESRSQGWLRLFSLGWEAEAGSRNGSAPANLRTRPAGAARRHGRRYRGNSLPDFGHDLHGLGVVKFGADLGDGRRAVAKDDAGCVEVAPLG